MYPGRLPLMDQKFTRHSNHRLQEYLYRSYMWRDLRQDTKMHPEAHAPRLGVCSRVSLIKLKENIQRKKASNKFMLLYSPQRNLVLPPILVLLRNEAGYIRVNISRRYGIGTRKLCPFNGQALAKLDHACLCSIVRSLELRNVCNPGAHGGSSDEASRRETPQALAVNVCASMLLAANVVLQP